MDLGEMHIVEGVIDILNIKEEIDIEIIFTLINMIVNKEYLKYQLVFFLRNNYDKIMLDRSKFMAIYYIFDQTSSLLVETVNIMIRRKKIYFPALTACYDHGDIDLKNKILRFIESFGSYESCKIIIDFFRLKHYYFLHKHQDISNFFI